MFRKRMCPRLVTRKVYFVSKVLIAPLAALALVVIAMMPPPVAAAGTGLSVDSGFGRNGRIVLPAYAAGRPQVVHATSTTEDGSLVVLSAIAPRGVKEFSGYHSPNERIKGVRFAMASIQPNGTVRRMAGGKRWSPARSVGKNGFLVDVAFDKFGRILLAYRTDANKTDPVLMRLKRDGSLDRAFGNGGRIRVEWPDEALSKHWGFDSFMVSPNGRIVLARSFEGHLDTQVFVLKSDGTPDTAFGDEGGLDLEGANYTNFEATKSGGLKLLSRTWSAATGSVGELLELNRRGRPKSSFGTNGRVSLPLEVLNFASSDTGETLVLWASRTGNYEFDVIVRRIDATGKTIADTSPIYHVPDSGDAGFPDDAGGGFRSTNRGFLYWWSAGYEDQGAYESELFFARRALPEDSTIRSLETKGLGMLFGGVDFTDDGRRMYASGTIGKPLKRVVVKRYRT